MPDPLQSPGFNTLGQFEKILDQFETAWRAGQRPDLNEFLAAGTEGVRPALFEELLAMELAYRRDVRESPSVSEYLAQFPQFAEQVRSRFASGNKIPRNPPAAPMSRGADRNLLFGILALQMDFITRDQLVAGMNAWVLDKAKSLDQVFVEQQVLRSDTQALLAALVNKHLELHGGDPQQSLAALSSVGDVKDKLRSVRDAELDVSLGHIGGGRLDGDEFQSPPSYEEAAGTVLEPLSTQVLRYRIVRPHAEGGLGEVFVARDQELNREVALKQMKPKHAENLDGRERFRQEAEITGNLEHPGIVPVYGLGQYDDGRPFYAMRFIRGDSLKEAIERFHRSRHAESDGYFDGERTVEFRKLLRRFIDVCNAIEYAHSRGVLHRDLKPGNVVLGKYGETLVVDWGLAKALGSTEHAEVSQAPVQPNLGSGSAPTMMGTAIGTPAYMSPEQAAGRLDQLGPATDVYSLGATLYHLLTGQAPFVGRNVSEVLRRVQVGDFPRPRDVVPNQPERASVQFNEAGQINESDQIPGASARRLMIPLPLESICLKAMALRASDRYASPLALAEDIERWLADEPVSVYREPLVVRVRRFVRRHQVAVTSLAAAVVVALVGLGALSAVVSHSNQRLNSANATITAKNEQLTTANTTIRDQNLAITGKNEELQTTNEQLAAARTDAEQQRDAVIEQKTRADAKAEEARRHLYSTRMHLVQRNWETPQVGLVLDLLDKTRPEPSERDLRGFEWQYWNRLCHSSLLDLKGHFGPVNSVTFSPDGKRLASAGGSFDGTVKVWNATSGQVTLSLRGHNSEVNSVVFSPDGKRLASASSDGTVKVWDTTTGQVTLTLTGHSDQVYCVAFSPDGNRLASASYDQTVKVWDATSGQEMLTLKGHTDKVEGVAFSPDGKRLASASNDQTVKVWDAMNGQESHTLNGHIGMAMSVAFSPDGKRLATAGMDRTVKVWDATSGQETFTLIGHTSGILGVAFSPDGKRLASASYDRTVKVWDANNGKEMLTLKGHTIEVSGVAFSPDGKRLASASADKTVKVWDTTIGQESLTWKENGVWNVAFSPDGKRLASACFHGVMMRDAVSGQETLALKGHTRPVSSVAFTPDGKRLASASADQTVRVWDAMSGQEMRTLKGHTNEVWGVAFSHDGKRLASASNDRTVKVWDAMNGQESLTLKGHTSGVMSVAFSPDGKRLASAGIDRTVKVWDATSGQETLTLKGHTEDVRRVAFSPDGKRLASASLDQTVKVWDATTGHVMLTLNGHDARVEGVTFSLDGKRLASAGWDHSVKLWDATSGEEILTLKGHTDVVTCVAFSADGNRLASSSINGTVRVWDARSWTPELRAEFEALGLIHFLRDRGNPQSTWLNAISSDQTLNEPVRQRALQFAREWK